MPTIPELEAKWRAAAKAQAEAKRAYDETVRQLQSGRTSVQVAAEPAVLLAASNLAKSTAEWRAAVDELLTAVQAISDEDSQAGEEMPH
jgi:hypothetical protein